MSFLSTAFKNTTEGGPITSSPELAAFLQVYGGWDSTSGISVTPETALKCAAISAAVGLISESIAQLPLMVYRRLDPRGKERASDTSLWRVLHDKPNRWQNSFEWREQMALHLTLWGNAYSLITRSQRGELSELLPIHPSRVTPKQDDQWNIIYKVRGPDGSEVQLARDRVFHVRDRSVDGIVGRPRIFDGKDTIGLALSAERWGGQLFGNGARPSGILSAPGKLGDPQIARLKETWTAGHGGANALGTAVLDNGFTWKPLVMNNTDAQFLETRKFQIAEVSRIYRVPPHMLGDLEKATFSNVEHMGLQYLKFSLLPWLKRVESAINDQLIGFGSGMFAEFLIDAFERADLAGRTAHYTAGIRDGYLSANDIRELENRNPIDNGDEYRRAESIHGPATTEATA